jgi:hypothetical protein
MYQAAWHSRTPINALSTHRSGETFATNDCEFETGTASTSLVFRCCHSLATLATHEYVDSTYDKKNVDLRCSCKHNTSQFSLVGDSHIAQTYHICVIGLVTHKGHFQLVLLAAGDLLDISAQGCHTTQHARQDVLLQRRRQIPPAGGYGQDRLRRRQAAVPVPRPQRRQSVGGARGFLLREVAPR